MCLGRRPLSDNHDGDRSTTRRTPSLVFGAPSSLHPVLLSHESPSRRLATASLEGETELTTWKLTQGTGGMVLKIPSRGKMAKLYKVPHDVELYRSCVLSGQPTAFECLPRHLMRSSSTLLSQPTTLVRYTACTASSSAQCPPYMSFSLAHSA